MWRTVVAGHQVRAKLWSRRLYAQAALGRARLFGLVVMLGAVLVLIAIVGVGAGMYLRQKDALELVESGIRYGLLAVAAALILSSLGHASQAFFSARELWWWDSSPAPPWVRFQDRATETLLAAAPPTATMATVALVGLCVGAEPVAWGRSVRVVVAVMMMVPVPVAIGITLAHVGGALLPAGRLRRAALLLLGLAITAGLVWLRQQRVEQLLTPEGAQLLLTNAQSEASSHSDDSWWPHRALAQFVVTGQLVAWLRAAVAVMAMTGAAMLSHQWLYHRARLLAIDESPTGLSPGGRAERALTSLLVVVPSSVRALVRKDVVSFVRDPAQWGQLVLLLGVAVLYVVNASAMRQGFVGVPHAAATILVGLHVGVVGFIAAGLAARFSFPQVGMEGPSFWLLESSPLSPTLLVRAKVWFTMPIVVGLPTVIAISGGIALGLPVITLVWTTLMITTMGIGITAMAVGKGAVQPLFDASNLSELAMGPGAIGAMMIAMTVSFVAMVGSTIAATAWHIHQGAWASWMGGSPSGWVVAMTMAAAILIPCGWALGLGWRGLGRGAVSLERRRQPNT
jgi:ABC-2 type transport system permease protein